jgi:hypothetical protein
MAQHVGQTCARIAAPDLRGERVEDALRNVLQFSPSRNQIATDELSALKYRLHRG